MHVELAAFRSSGVWYDIRYRCEVDGDATRVTTFSFAVGDKVPRSQWPLAVPGSLKEGTLRMVQTILKLSTQGQGLYEFTGQSQRLRAQGRCRCRAAHGVRTPYVLLADHFRKTPIPTCSAT